MSDDRCVGCVMYIAGKKCYEKGGAFCRRYFEFHEGRCCRGCGVRMAHGDGYGAHGYPLCEVCSRELQRKVMGR